MKVLIINGSPRKCGNTSIALDEIIKEFKKENIEVVYYQIGNKSIRGCIACGKCHEKGQCVFNDIVNEVLPHLASCDALIVGSPVYYASGNGTLISFLDRLFYANKADLTMKVGASVVALRRGGASSTFDELNKYFTISGMPICSSYYWNSIHGLLEEEAKEDKEGLQTMRCLARNMIFLMKAIKDAKEKYGAPQREMRIATNFIR